MEKEKLEKLIFKYTGVAGAILGVQSLQAQGEIIHTDVPDSTLDRNGDFYMFDINQDTVMDFRLNLMVDSTAHDITAVTIEHAGNAANQVAGIDYSRYNYPFRMWLGDTISANQTFKGINPGRNAGYLGFMVDSVPYPNSQWLGGVSDGFLGIRFRGLQNDTMRTFYGWIRLDVAADLRSVTIKDFAYRSEADSMITAGQLFVDIEEAYVAQNRPQLSQRGQLLDVEIPETFKNPQAELHFMDLTGRPIKNLQLSGYKNTVELEGLPSGIHIATVISGGISSSCRVVIY